jgi:DNA-binding NtrC family response regulator
MEFALFLNCNPARRRAAVRCVRESRENQNDGSESEDAVRNLVAAAVALEGKAMPKVLVADDQADMRWLLSRLLEEQGFEVSTAADGAQVLSWVQQETPHAILLDLKMPRLDGLQALTQLKELAPEVPVIVLTAYGDVPSAVQAMKLGAYDFITKPFDNNELLYTVKRAVERRELLAR